jgi:ATP-dependent DNA ligase
MAEPFPEVIAALQRLPAAFIDAELVVPDHDGRSDFAALRRRAVLRRSREIARSVALGVSLRKTGPSIISEPERLAVP